MADYNFQPRRKVYRNASGQEYTAQEKATVNLRRGLRYGFSSKKLPGLTIEERLHLQNAMSRAQDFCSTGTGEYQAFLAGCSVTGLDPKKIQAYFAGEIHNQTDQQRMAGVFRLFEIYSGKHNGSSWAGFLTVYEKTLFEKKLEQAKNPQTKRKPRRKYEDPRTQELPLAETQQTPLQRISAQATLENDLTEDDVFAPTFPRWPANHCD